MAALGHTTSRSLCIFLTLSLLACGGRGEVFTAIVHMEGLLHLERELLSGLNEYIVAERARLSSLERFANRVEEVLDTSSNDVSQHLFDPVNVFHLLNRYTNTWMKLHENVYRDNAQNLMANISMNRYRFPSEEDYNGAITAIWRLQATYKLPASTIAHGKLGSSQGLPLTSSDAYAFGRKAYLEKKWKQAREWMLVALNLFDEEQGVSDLSIPDVYDHLSFSEYSLGNMKRAAQYTRELLQHDPYHARALKNQVYFDGLAANSPDKYADNEKEDYVSDEHKAYESLCREPKPIPSKDHHKLTCYYFDHNRNPRLILSPIKTELVFLQPKLYVFHDFLSEAEMDRLKELAEPRLRRATARSHASGEFEPVDYRISKSGWLGPEHDPLGYVSRIDQRIDDTTGLDMSTAEQLQVVNYGIGGHYEPHYDFARDGEDAFSSLGAGNRVATLLIYMSDVEVGGATVFPLVGARVAPEKGSAAFWWNLKKSGAGDYSTRHAGCPVVVGSKWVCNKWIHERGQEFRRPCGLSPDE